MAKFEVSGSRWLQALSLLAMLIWTSGCAGVSTHGEWPDVDIEADVPEGGDGEPRLMRGGDGAWYAVGQFDTAPTAGQIVFGRYGAQWPLDEMAPPAMFAGEVVDRHSDEVVRVHPLYEFPDVEPETLALEFSDDWGDETMGKGVGSVVDISQAGEDAEGAEDKDRRPSDQATYLTLSLGAQQGVQQGDNYGVILPYDGDAGPQTAQLTRRLSALCMVVETDADSSQCRVRPGHPDHDLSPEVEEGRQVMFLEPSFGTEPPEATVMVSGVDDEQIDEWIVDHLESYLHRFPGGNVTVELVDEQADATDPNFHRWSRKLSSEGPALFVGASLIGDPQDQRLTLNYTGVTTAIGPGLVAAPPEGGVDMGAVDDIGVTDWRGFSSMLMGSVLVYRGQTALALRHLQRALQDEALTGKWRWHARDQYAMRWGALDRFEEAIWLVLEDEAVAIDAGDQRAEYNALGTRVRLHDYLDQPQEALESARRYLDWRIDDDPTGAGYLSARAMYAEMAMKAEESEIAEEAVDEIIERCPEGCQGDALALLAGVYWASMDTSPELQDRIVEAMVRLGERHEYSSLASARMFQGWTFMRDEDFGQALMAFLEAERRYEQDEQSAYGVARAQMYISIVEIRRGEPQRAYESGTSALDYMSQIGDHQSALRIYERLAELYMDPEAAGPRDTFMRAAPRILQSGIQMQLGAGDYRRAAQAKFSYANVMFRAGALDEARTTLYRAVTRAIRTASFETVAMCHVVLAVIARAEGDGETFEQELQRAEQMAELADDPYLDDLIDELRAPPEQEPPDDDPTQLL